MNFKYADSSWGTALQCAYISQNVILNLSEQQPYQATPYRKTAAFFCLTCAVTWQPKTDVSICVFPVTGCHHHTTYVWRPLF